jgi:hypothetical protein
VETLERRQLPKGLTLGYGALKRFGYHLPPQGD